MGGNSTTWMNTAILVTCIRNFRKNRGPVSGILKGYVGLSTAIFTVLCSALFNNDPGKFLLMLSITPLAICLTAMIFLREIPPSDDQEESKYFWLFNGVAIVVAVYLLTYDFIPNPTKLFSQIFASILLVLLASPMVIPVYSFVSGRVGQGSDLEAKVVEPLLKPEIAPAAEVTPTTVEAATEKRKPVIGEEHTIWEALQCLDFWILFVSFLCGVGTGLAVMNNMGQIGLALGYVDVSIFVSLTSIWGFFGRIISGTTSEYFIRYGPISFFALFQFYFFI